LYGEQNVMNALLQFLSNQDRIDSCGDSKAPALVLEVYKKLMDLKRERGINLRFLTEINSENINYCKELMKFADAIRHLEGIKANFAVRNTEYIGLATMNEAQQPLIQSHIIYSNVKGIVEQQQYLFNSLWDKSIPAEQRIKEIEEGIQTEFFEIINDSKKIGQILVDLAKSVVNEIVLLLPNDRALVRVDRLGVIDSLLKASQNGATIKIICPLSEVNSKIQKKISENAPDIRILDGNNSPYGMYIIDRKKFLRAELKRPGAEKFSDAIGLVMYSNRRTTVDSFESVFELLWNERMLVEELKKADRMQKEFISIAAHELKTPIQAILGMSSLLKYYPERTDQVVEVISRNAVRLQRLSANILDATRIESQTLKLEKERFNICDLIPTIIEDYREKIKDSTNDKVKLIYSDNLKNNNPIVVAADRERIIQVISNLLSNSIQFTSEGYISLNIVVDNNSNEVIVTVRDTGTGINPEILPRLFSKFVTRSQKGTGLGLFISKSIIEAHGGRIWAENNSLDGQGTIFSFTLPLETKNGTETEKSRAGSS
jgi:two-component system, OmpR family, sensor histidine kinase VicK